MKLTIGNIWGLQKEHCIIFLCNYSFIGGAVIIIYMQKIAPSVRLLTIF